MCWPSVEAARPLDLSRTPSAVAVSHYVGVLAPGNEALRDRIDQILREAMRDGRLEAIYRKWKIWNDDQPELFAKVLAGAAIPPVTGYQTDSIATLPKWEATRRYLPSLLRAAVDHARAVVRRDARRGRPRRRDRDRPAVRRPDHADGADRVRRADSRHAAAAAALRPVLRHRGGDPAALHSLRRSSGSR